MTFSDENYKHVKYFVQHTCTSIYTYFGRSSLATKFRLCEKFTSKIFYWRNIPIYMYSIYLFLISWQGWFSLWVGAQSLVGSMVPRGTRGVQTNRGSLLHQQDIVHSELLRTAARSQQKLPYSTAQEDKERPQTGRKVNIHVHVH